MKAQDFILEVYSHDTSPVGVLSAVDTTNLPDLKARITEVLRDHYATEHLTCDDIPDWWAADQGQHKFYIEFTITDGAKKYMDTVHVTPIIIYSKP